MRKLFLLMTQILISQNIAFSQGSLTKFGPVYFNPTNAQGYLEPLNNSLNFQLASSWFAQHEGDSSIHVYAGVQVTRSYIPASMEMHMGQTELPFTPPQQTVQAPTIFGPNQSLEVEDAVGYVYSFPGGFEYTNTTFGIPQIQIGGILNTDITFRFAVLQIDNEKTEYGNFNTFGIGIQHALQQYLSLSKIDLRIGYAYQSVKIGEWYKSNLNVVQVQAGQQINFFNYYSFLGYSGLNSEYRYEDETVPDEKRVVDVHATNRFLFGLGFGLRYSILKFHSEAILLKPVTISIGLGIEI